MKVAVVCPDGAADWPLPNLNQRTPLAAAHLPHLARLAREGFVGRVTHVPPGMDNGSDVCVMSLLGLDPARYHTGRAPLEAKSLGVELGPEDVAVRLNTVTVTDGRMSDYSAGHITTAESTPLVQALENALGREGRRFYPGVQYRHLLVLRHPGGLEARCTPPHNITGRQVAEHLPKGKDGELLRELMERSQAIFAAHPVNQARVARGEYPATQAWLWGHGRRPELPSFRELFGLSGALISAVDLLRSIGLLMGLEVLQVPGITGFVDTNYRGKGEHACAALERHDLVVVHVEAPDECGHIGDERRKLESLERIDAEIVSRLLNTPWARRGELRVLVCPDHPTPCTTKTHTSDPVPFLAWGPGVPANGLAYDEVASLRSAFDLPRGRGHELLGCFLRGELK